MKDKAGLWIGIGAMVAVIGLLMAWTDGAFDGTFLGELLEVLMPAAVSGFGVMIVVSFWVGKLTGSISGKVLLWSFLVTLIAVGAMLIFPVFEPVLEVLLYIGLGIVVITLVMVWLANL